MTMTLKSEVRQGAYYDSVVLMQLQKALAELPGVADAGVVMATEANKDLLDAGDLLPAGIAAKADDLLIVVKGESETAVTEAMAQVDELLTRRKPGAAVQANTARAAWPLPPNSCPKRLGSLISVPGRYAAGVAEEALDLGKHVFPLQRQRPAGRRSAPEAKSGAANGLLLMGPDCGTAIVNGIGLGFANRVRRGRIGLVAASGTGLQAVSSEIHNLGSGISQAIGTGGRDLKAEVGHDCLASGATVGTGSSHARDCAGFQATIAQVATQLLQAAQATGKQVVVNFIGFPPPGHKVGNIHFATSLVETAELAVHMATTVETSLALARAPAGRLAMCADSFPAARWPTRRFWA